MLRATGTDCGRGTIRLFVRVGQCRLPMQDVVCRPSCRLYSSCREEDRRKPRFPEQSIDHSGPAGTVLAAALVPSGSLVSSITLGSWPVVPDEVVLGAVTGGGTQLPIAPYNPDTSDPAPFLCANGPCALERPCDSYFNLAEIGPGITALCAEARRTEQRRSNRNAATAQNGLADRANRNMSRANNASLGHQPLWAAASNALSSLSDGIRRHWQPTSKG